MKDKEQKMPSNNEAELREELRQGSEAKCFGTRLTPDGKETVEMIPLDWAVETIKAHNRQLLEAILKGIEERVCTRGISLNQVEHGYNIAVQDIRAHIKKLLTEEG